MQGLLGDLQEAELSVSFQEQFQGTEACSPRRLLSAPLLAATGYYTALSVPAVPKSQESFLSVHLPTAPGICSLSCVLAPDIMAGWEKPGLLLQV